MPSSVIFTMQVPCSEKWPRRWDVPWADASRGELQSWTLLLFCQFFSFIKNDFLYIFHQVNNLFLHQSYLKTKKSTPGQIYRIKNAKNHFLLVKTLKNTSSAQLWSSAGHRAAGHLWYFLAM